MQIIYNQQGIGDVLIVTLDQKNTEITSVSSGDVTEIKEKDSGEVVGYNIFQASTHIDIPETHPILQTDDLIEKIGQVIEAEGFTHNLNEVDRTPKFIVGKVEEMSDHPDASKLNVCQVNVGDQQQQIVCGAPNVDAGQKVVVALPGAIMPNGMKIVPSQLRGVDSHGMICSAKELNLPNASQEKGILVLDDERTVGEAFFQ